MSRSRSASGPRSRRIAAALFDGSLVLLPRRLRERHGDDIAADFRALAADAPGGLALVRVTLSAIGDVVGRSLRMRLRHASPRGSRPPRLGLAESVRALRRQPAFTALSIVTLALAIAAVASIGALVESVVLRPLPFPESGRLVRLDHDGPGISAVGLGITDGLYALYREESELLSDLAIYLEQEVTLIDERGPRRAPALRTTWSLGQVLGIVPAHGRWFVAEEGEPEGPRVALIGHALWTRLGGDPRIVGTSLDVTGVPHEIVGVLPRGLSFPDPRLELWLPLAVDSDDPRLGGFGYQGVGRMRAGATHLEVDRDLARLIERLPAEFPDEIAKAEGYRDSARLTPATRSLHRDLVGDLRSTLWMLMGSVGLVLGVAAANVANLLLVRAERRGDELATRAALGASRLDLSLLFLGESLVLFGSAAALGLSLAAGVLAWLRAATPVEIPRLQEVGLSAPVVLGVAAVAVVLALLAGVLPLLQRGTGGAGEGASRLGGGRRATGDRARMRLRSALVVVQLGLALVLLVAAGLLVRSYRHLRAVDPGFASGPALTFEIGLPRQGYEAEGAWHDFHRELLARLRARPEVSLAGAVAPCLPLQGWCWGDPLWVDGRVYAENETPPIGYLRTTVPGYFQAAGIPLLRGRDFGDADLEGPHTAVVSAEFERRHFGDESAVGRWVRTGGPRGDLHQIVGVVGDVAHLLTADPAPVAYFVSRPDPLYGPSVHSMRYVVRAAVPPLDLVSTIQSEVRELDAGIPVAAVRTLDGLVREASAPVAFVTLLLVVAAGLASLLGVVGIYAVIAFAVTRRRSEIGIRLAVGARPLDIEALVLRQGAGLAALGIAAGSLAALGLGRVIEANLYGVEAADPVTFVVVGASLFLVALAAMWLPARAAAAIDPATTLTSS